jgi:hypothetical protein
MLSRIEKIVLASFSNRPATATQIRKRFFTKKRSANMYKLASLTGNQRGFAVERIVGESAQKTGNDVVFYGGTSEFDIMINGMKVEVKSAMCDGPSGKDYSKGKNAHSQVYRWVGIKNLNFHYLVLVAVTPTGLRYKIVDSLEFQRSKWKYGKVYGERGYNWCENGWFARYKMKPISKLGAEITELVGLQQYCGV